MPDPQNRPELPVDPRAELHLFALRLVCRDRATDALMWEEDGELQFAPGWSLNRLFDEGEKIVGELFFRGQTTGGLSAQFWGRLYNDVPVDTDQLANLTGEPASNGYQAQPWSRNTSDFGNPQLVGGQTEWLGVKRTFNATGAGWGPVTHFVMATTSDNSGKPVAWVALSQSRSVPGGTGLDVTPRAFIRGMTV